MIEDNITGIGYKFGSDDALVETLEMIKSNPQKIIDMKAGTKKLQQELVLVLDKAGMPKEVVNYVSTTVEKNAEDKNRKQQIYRSIISKYGQTKGLNIYNHIKKKI